MTSVKLPQVSKLFSETTNKASKMMEKNLGISAKPNFAGMLQGSYGKVVPQSLEIKAESTNSTLNKTTTSASEKIKVEKPEKLDEEKTEKLKEEVAQFDQGIFQVVTNLLGISPEEIQQFLQTNDLQPMDLLQAGNLALLVNGTGENTDIMDLLNSEEFLQLLGEVDIMGKQLMETSGLSIADLSKFVSKLNENPQVIIQLGQQREPLSQILDLPEDVIQSMLGESLIKADKIPNGEQREIQIPVEGPIASDIQVITTDIQEEVIPILNNGNVQDEEAKPTTLMGQIVEELVQGIEQDTNIADEQEMDSETGAKQPQLTGLGEKLKSDNGETMENKGNLFSMNQKLDSLPVLDKIQTLETVVNIQEVIDKIGEYAKLSVGNQISTMEMQLNPENLGKLFVTITSHNGEITARIAAQTQLAKEVIDSQISQFRENLNQNGIKVEAVEVTVSTHEFERNLSGNQSMMNQEQQEKKQPKRRMMNESEFTLSNLQGLMSEEDQVLARMMKENGNTLDYQI